MVMVVLWLATGPARAQDAAQGDADALGRLDQRPPGEDEALYLCGKASAEVTVNLRPGADLTDLVSWAMGFTCKNFVYSSRIPGGRSLTATVISPSKMSPEQAWRLFLVALQSMNLTVVAKGNVLEIVESPTAKRQALPLYRPGSRAPGGEQIGRILLRPQRVSVEDLVTALQPLASADGELVPLPRAGLLVATDHGSHVARMRELVEEIERAAPDAEIFTLPVTRARAAEVAQIVREVLAIEATPAKGGDPAPAAGSPLRILIDERSNALVIHATRAAYQRARALVERLDIDVEGGATSRAHVVPLRYGDAEKMAATLSALFGGGPAAAARPRPAAPAGSAEGRPAASGEAAAVEGQVRVIADPLSNAILVWSSTRDFLAVREIVRQLDGPRAQVFIEAMIVEVATGSRRDVGAAFHGGRLDREDNLWFGGVGHEELSSLVDLGRAAESGQLGWTGLMGGVIGGPIPGLESLIGTTIPSFAVLFRALASNDHVDILSAPTLMTTDNVKAVLSIGQNVAYKSGVSGVTGTPGVALESIQREKVALTLEVTPHVGAAGQVRLDLDLTIQDLLGTGEFGPTWSERKVANTVVVGDGDTAVIGGLMARKKVSTVSKTPLLGDLPLFGHLFRRTRSEEQKTNLVVLLTPFVLADPLDRARTLDRVFERRSEFLGALDRLGAMEYRPRLDPARKRGLLSAIDQRVREVDAQRTAREALERPQQVPAGPVLQGEEPR
jgi:general secretion pathway protein D